MITTMIAMSRFEKLAVVLGTTERGIGVQVVVTQPFGPPVISVQVL